MSISFVLIDGVGHHPVQAHTGQHERQQFEKAREPGEKTFLEGCFLNLFNLGLGVKQG